MNNSHVIKQLLIICIFVLLCITISNRIAYSNNSYVIKNIYFEGLQKISVNTAIYYIPFNIGDTITDDDIANAIKALFATEKFEKIQILNNQSSLTIRVQEYPIISNIIFHGNKTIKTEILKNNLKLYNIQTENFLNPSSISKIKESLKKFYYNIGKYNVLITIKTIMLPNNQVKLKIIIDEGKTSKIRKINIIGNHIFETKKLLNLFQLNINYSLWNLFPNKQYTQELLLYDLESLRAFYTNRGFAKFNIDSTQTKFSLNKKNIFITIYVTEGSQYTISNILIDGNLSNFSTTIKNSLNIQSGELYNQQKIQNSIYNIKKILGNYGYINPDILMDFKTNDKNKTIKLYLNIDIGQRFYIRKIKFQGNTITKDSVLRREIRQMEKTWINNYLIYQGEERLNRLGYFESVEVLIKRIPGTLDQLDVIYQVKEHNTGNININLGIGSESGIHFQCGIQQDNLFGTGNSFNLNGTKNNYQTYIELSANNPYFTTSNIGLGGKIFYNDFNTDNTDFTTYALKSYGTNSNITFPSNEYNSLSLSINYMYNNLSHIKPQIAIWRYLNSQGICPKIINSYTKNNIIYTDTNTHFSSNDIFLKLQWKFNNLNHGYFPTYGAYSNLSSKITLPGSTNQYYKIIADINHYIPLSNSHDWIFMYHIHTGYANGLYGKKENPFFDNFYAGGINTVRGFRANTIGPKAVYYTFNQNNNTYTSYTISKSNDAIGGNAIVILQGELITPTPFLNKKYTNLIRTSIFFDLGSVWDTYWKNTKITQMANIPNYKSPTNIRVSSGLAVQWMSPLGPIVFSYAKLLKQYTGDKLEQFQFNIGKTW